MGKKIKIRIRDEHPESSETIFWVKILKFLNADADRGSRIFFDLGSEIREGKNSDPGSGSATLLLTI